MKVKIGDRLIGGDEPVFVIAEIGINHNGDLDVAKQLIDASVEAGADAVKFQKRTVDVVYTEEDLARPRENPFGDTNGDLKYGLEFSLDDYAEIDRYCKDKIMWFASCWDEGSVDLINRFHPPCFKIASASLTDRWLLAYTASRGKPLIASTGMSSLEQIRSAVGIIDSELILLHCVSTYPAEDSELNLRVIQAMMEEYDFPIGYSGHERGTVTSVMAVVLGASVIERHITLDRTMWGSDQQASIDPWEFETLVHDIRSWEESRGDGKKRVLESEIPVMEKLRRKDTV